MKYLELSDFVPSTNIPNVLSPVATYTCPLSVAYEILGGIPYHLAITAYQSQTVATPSATFTITTNYNIQVPTDEYGNPLYAITAIAYDVTANNILPVVPTNVSGNVITFPGIQGAANGDTIGVWYRLGQDYWSIYVKTGTTKQTSFMIETGAVRTLNAIDQYNAKTLLTFAQNYPLAPGDQLIIAVKSPATISMSTRSIATGFNYELNTAAMLRFPVNVVTQPA